MSEELVVAVNRLLECLRSPLDSRILGRQTVREVVYRVLLGEQGGSLRALASRDDHFARIARVVKHIRARAGLPANRTASAGSFEDLAQSRYAIYYVRSFASKCCHHYRPIVLRRLPAGEQKVLIVDCAEQVGPPDTTMAGQAFE